MPPFSRAPLHTQTPCTENQKIYDSASYRYLSFWLPEGPLDDLLEGELVACKVLADLLPTVYVSCRADCGGAEKLSSLGLEQFTALLVNPQHCHLFDVEL